MRRFPLLSKNYAGPALEEESRPGVFLVQMFLAACGGAHAMSPADNGLR